MNWQDKLTQAGYRLSQPRRIVMDMLAKAKVPMAPQDVINKAKDINALIGMVSVYRTLTLLAKLGLIKLVHLEDGSSGYVLSSAGHHHHIICRFCEQVIEFEGLDDMDSLISRLQSETGFKISDHLLQFYGICPACQKAHMGYK